MGLKELWLAWSSLKLAKGGGLEFYFELNRLLIPHAEDNPIPLEEIKEILNRFWSFVTINIKLADWLNSDIVNTFVEFQAILAEKEFLPKNFHYPILYNALANQYNFLQDELALDESNNSLGILLLLLSASVKQIGNQVVDPQRMDLYPLNQLDITNRNTIETLTRLFLFILYYLNKEQSKLVPLLIHLEDKEDKATRNSKIALFNFMLNKGTLLEQFFSKEYLITLMQEKQFIANLNENTNLLGFAPQQLFIFISLFAKPKTTKVEEVVAKLFELFFFEEISPNEILLCCLKLKKIMDKLTITGGNVTELIENALKYLRVIAYIAHREGDGRVSYSNYALLGMNSKITAAYEYLEYLKTGKPMSYLSLLAIKEGDLKLVIAGTIKNFAELKIEDFELLELDSKDDYDAPPRLKIESNPGESAHVKLSLLATPHLSLLPIPTEASPYGTGRNGQ